MLRSSLPFQHRATLGRQLPTLATPSYVTPFSISTYATKTKRLSGPIPREPERLRLRNAVDGVNIEQMERPLDIIVPRKERNAAMMKELFEHIRNNNAEAAFMTFQSISFKHDIRPYCALLKLCAANKLMGEAVELVHDIRVRKLTFNYVVFQHFMETALATRNVARGMWGLKEMQERIRFFGKSEKGKKQALKVCVTLLRLCMEENRYDRAAVVLREIYRHNLLNENASGAHRPKTVAAELALQVAGNEADAEVFKKMVEEHLVPGKMGTMLQ